MQRIRKRMGGRWAVPPQRLALGSRIFISHAYADANQRDELLALLPRTVEAVTFPPIVVPPAQFVSSHLVESIQSCESLIYLTGGRSDSSFWVAFERDLALRLKMAVFRAEPTTHALRPDSGASLDLAVFASYHHGDRERVRQVAQYLEKERHFDVWMDVGELHGDGELGDEISRSINERLRRGGYVIVFWSRLASESPWVQRELEDAAKGVADWNDRVLFALLDDVPIPSSWQTFSEPAVQIYGDGMRSQNHRLDDLVVRLYWLIYRKTKTLE